jgi:hypothetical protein
MRRRAWRTVEFVLLVGGMVGLVRLLAVFSGCVANWWISKPGVITVGCASLAYIVWWLRRSVGAEDRRTLIDSRSIKDGQRASLRSALAKHTNANDVATLIVSEYGEPQRFSIELAKALDTEGPQAPKQWPSHWALDTEANSVAGVRVEVGASTTKEHKIVAKAIARWLQDEEFSGDGLREMPEPVTHPSVLFGKHPIPIRITVGRKR